jgi:hypothetical protein
MLNISLATIEQLATFDRRVFVNCPYDREYREFLRIIIYTVIRCGLCPVIADDCSNSAKPRLENIVKLIGDSKFSIHDISRIDHACVGTLPRFNMPFELGIDIGCREHGSDVHRNKCSLVLEEQQFRYRTVLSDISGNDIKAHGNDGILLVKSIRDWLYKNGFYECPNHHMIYERYCEFQLTLQNDCRDNGYPKGDYSEMSMLEFKHSIWRLDPD